MKGTGNMNNKQKSIIDMARGAFTERIDYEMAKVINNILDPNTKATAKRKLNLTIEFSPDDERSNIVTKVTVKSTLPPLNPAMTSLYVATNHNGDATIVEMTPQIPGQSDMYGEEQEAPAELRLIVS